MSKRKRPSRAIRKKIPLSKLKDPKKCPFCGGFKVSSGTLVHGDETPAAWYGVCYDCDGCGPVMGGNEERAKAAWNHRGGPATLFSEEARGTPLFEEPVVERDEDDEVVDEAPCLIFANPKPCPWCSGMDIAVFDGALSDNKPYYYAYCQVCEAIGPATDTTAGLAATAWNRRTK